MNDRIRELMEQASSNACYDEPGQLHLMNDEIEKFAELIVRECAELVEDYTKQRAYNTYYNAAEQIREHFGDRE